MTEQKDQEKSIYLKEILVAMDTSAHSQAALQAAVELAKTMDANVRGLFVQDELWDKISQLPSITSVNTFTGRILPFESKALKDQVRILRNRLRQKLEYLSRRNQVTHSWHFTSGKVEEEILEAAQKADLITIGLKGVSAGRKVLGSSARKIIQESNVPVLILKEGLRLGTTLTAVYDGSEESQKGIKLALEIAEKNDSILFILVLNNNWDTAEQRNNKIEELMENSAVFTKVLFLEQVYVSNFLNSVNKQRPGLLIIPKNQPLLTKSFEVILNHINCPLLLVS